MSAITSVVGMQPTGTDIHTFNYLDLVGYLAVNNLNPAPLGYVGGSDVFPDHQRGCGAGHRRGGQCLSARGGTDVGHHAHP